MRVYYKSEQYPLKILVNIHKFRVTGLQPETLPRNKTFYRYFSYNLYALLEYILIPETEIRNLIYIALLKVFI